MKYLDLSVQSILLLLGAGGVITQVITGDWSGAGGCILYMQLFLGPWQYASSLISVITRAPMLRQKKLHLIASSLYLIVVILISNSPVSNNFPGYVVIPGLTVIPCTLAIYYYVQTWRWARQRSHNGKFLPHINF